MRTYGMSANTFLIAKTAATTAIYLKLISSTFIYVVYFRPTQLAKEMPEIYYFWILIVGKI
jgi:hypothetical protein